MARREKVVQTWLTNTPRYAPVDQVEAILDYYFPGQVRKRSSHRVVNDARLAPHPGFEPNGEFTVCITGGQRVKGLYLERLARAIQIIQEIEGIEDEDS